MLVKWFDRYIYNFVKSLPHGACVTQMLKTNRKRSILKPYQHTEFHQQNQNNSGKKVAKQIFSINIHL